MGIIIFVSVYILTEKDSILRSYYFMIVIILFWGLLQLWVEVSVLLCFQLFSPPLLFLQVSWLGKEGPPGF